jgi:uncharacterized protein (DUF1501 family)
LLGLTASFTAGRYSVALAAAATQKRFVVVILRGALDGMSAVVPYGDANMAQWRASLVPGQPGAEGGLLDLGGFYGLNPALSGFHAMYQANELLPVHAVAGPYRVRSHFEAQDYLEFGSDHAMTSGWLNRLSQEIPASKSGSETAATVGSWLPPSFAQPAPELYARLMALHAHDPITGPAIREGLKERGFTEATLANAPGQGGGGFGALCQSTGRLLAAPDGPRLAALEIGGWDTHTQQKNRLTFPLRQLDEGMVQLKAGLGDAWRNTTVLVMTEFGRTVRVNGTGGTDHGTGTVAFVLGGDVAGGRVQANWPGLAQGNLFENRDLQPTADLRAVTKGLIGPLFGRVFPQSERATAVEGLIRAV